MKDPKIDQSDERSLKSDELVEHPWKFSLPNSNTLIHDGLLVKLSISSLIQLFGMKHIFLRKIWMVFASHAEYIKKTIIKVYIIYMFTQPVKY
jgi:hypothetical protein